MKWIFLIFVLFILYAGCGDCTSRKNIYTIDFEILDKYIEPPAKNISAKHVIMVSDPRGDVFKIISSSLYYFDKSKNITLTFQYKEGHCGNLYPHGDVIKESLMKVFQWTYE